MSEQMNIHDLQNRVDFLVNGGALKILTDFLNEKGIKALIVEPNDSGSLNVIDAAGLVPEGLTVSDEASQLFVKGVPHEAYELDFAEGSKSWPCIIRIRGSQWAVYILVKDKPSDIKSLLEELKPYAGLLRLWKTFKNIDSTEKKLARLSYIILVTKSTLASIFEPMPLQYFASFLTDVLQESLFPKSIVILKDEGSYLTVFNGKADSIPERKGIYASAILPPAPVIVRRESPAEVVLPVAEGECRLFCVMQWDELPDDQTMNFLELLGSLAVRAIAINNLRTQSREAEASIAGGEFTVLSLTNVLKVLKGAETREKFCSLLADIFVEQSRMSSFTLAAWDSSRKGYTIAEHRSGHMKASADSTLLPSPSGILPNSGITESCYDIAGKSADAVFKSWGLAGCPWKEAMSGVKYLFPVCDDNSLAGIIALGAGQDGRAVLDRSQLASLQLIAQFAAYEFKRFE